MSTENGKLRKWLVTYHVDVTETIDAEEHMTNAHAGVEFFRDGRVVATVSPGTFRSVKQVDAE